MKSRPKRNFWGFLGIIPFLVSCTYVDGVHIPCERDTKLWYDDGSLSGCVLSEVLSYHGFDCIGTITFRNNGNLYYCDLANDLTMNNVSCVGRYYNAISGESIGT